MITRNKNKHLIKKLVNQGCEWNWIERLGHFLIKNALILYQGYISTINSGVQLHISNNKYLSIHLSINYSLGVAARLGVASSSGTYSLVTLTLHMSPVQQQKCVLLLILLSGDRATHPDWEHDSRSDWSQHPEQNGTSQWLVLKVISEKAHTVYLCFVNENEMLVR